MQKTANKYSAKCCLQNSSCTRMFYICNQVTNELHDKVVVGQQDWGTKMQSKEIQNKQSHDKVIDAQCATNIILDPKKMLQGTKQLIQKKK